MNAYAKHIKKKLDQSINNLSQIIYLFSKRPGKDFTRNRGLPIKKLVELMISMGGNTQTKELLEYFKFSINTPTSSALIQQRNKLMPEAFAFLLREFVDSLKNLKTFRGYRLIAVDGSKVGIPLNPDDEENHILSNENSKGFNLLHINGLYDICNKLYIDARIQSYRKMNEPRALVDMVIHSTIIGKVILLADRGYESYNAIAHLEHKKWNYLIRVKAPNSGTGILSKTGLPVDKEFDEIICVQMTRRQTLKIKRNPKLYRFLAKNSTFDFLPHKSKGFYPVTFRVVCVKISDDNYQYLITNLNSNLFSLDDLKELYNKRWGIEISYRELKHTIAMTHFHSKKVVLIKQEIYAKMILYNFCELITLRVVVSQKDRKHSYQVNFTNAMHICIRFLRYCCDKHPPDVEALIMRYILPIREGRNFPRKIKTQPCVSFLYRVA